MSILVILHVRLPSFRLYVDCCDVAYCIFKPFVSDACYGIAPDALRLSSVHTLAPAAQTSFFPWIAFDSELPLFAGRSVNSASQRGLPLILISS